MSLDIAILGANGSLQKQVSIGVDDHYRLSQVLSGMPDSLLARVKNYYAGADFETVPRFYARTVSRFAWTACFRRLLGLGGWSSRAKTFCASFCESRMRVSRSISLCASRYAVCTTN